MAKGVRVSFFLMSFLLGLSVAECLAVAQDQQSDNIKIADVESDSTLVHSYLDSVNKAKDEGKIRQVRNILGRVQRIADSLAVPGLIKAVEKEFGEYYLETSSYDSAETVLEQAAKRASTRGLQIGVLNLLGTAYRYQSQYAKAINTYNNGLALVDSLKNQRTYMAITTNKAAIYEALGNMSKAVATYQDGINFAEAIKDSSFLATALNNLGNLYFEEENFKEAQTYLKEAIAISESRKLYTTLFRATHNLASTERDLGNYDKARELFQQAWALHQKIRPNSPPIQLLYNMGMYHLRISELEEAEEHFRESLTHSQKAGIPPGLFYNSIGLGDVALARENYASAINFYNDALDIARKVGAPPFRVTATQKLYEAYKEKGNFEQALTFHELSQQVSDSLTEAQQDKQLALAETELGLRQQQKINQLLQEKQKQQEARITIQNWLIAASVAVILAILISLYLFYRSNADKQRINEELQAQRNQLQELNRVKDKMLAIISHDLRSPLASMQGMLYMLREEGLSKEEIKEMASHLEMSVNQNLSMMDNLLAWAQEQMSGLELDLEPVVIRDIVEAVFENCEFRARHKGIILKNEVTSELKVKADPNLLNLILRNLISNSIKFSKEGDEVTVRAKEYNGEVLFEVIDTGIGIPKQNQDSLFGLNNHSRTGTKNEKGSGLGLQLCKEFIEKQEGEINIDSTEGVGTTIKFSLPKAS